MSETRYQEGLEVYSDSAAHAPEVSPHGVYSQGSKDPISGYVQVVEARKGPFGLSILSLCALVAIVTAVVVGAGVGGVHKYLKSQLHPRYKPSPVQPSQPPQATPPKPPSQSSTSPNQQTK
ncbi:hypothetical protein J7337_008163 [Fusarium musae]|uniref:Uncharacterized protein n=1 Tax=Fusarium musae TaxID=1042133 RepID=A0A9P8DD10_9HYPO|nr:hypothetical protein J7337_008163 [Fusarium musae]KAG9499704.1 hypothetical protein J7337_008163 [Fusarium musae]